MKAWNFNENFNIATRALRDVEQALAEGHDPDMGAYADGWTAQMSWAGALIVRSTAPDVEARYYQKAVTLLVKSGGSFWSDDPSFDALLVSHICSSGEALWISRLWETKMSRPSQAPDLAELVSRVWAEQGQDKGRMVLLSALDSPLCDNEFSQQLILRMTEGGVLDCHKYSGLRRWGKGKNAEKSLLNFLDQLEGQHKLRHQKSIEFDLSVAEKICVDCFDDGLPMVVVIWAVKHMHPTSHHHLMDWAARENHHPDMMLGLASVLSEMNFDLNMPIKSWMTKGNNSCAEAPKTLGEYLRETLSVAHTPNPIVTLAQILVDRNDLQEAMKDAGSGRTDRKM